ncbi:hypothetical protein LJC42_00550 [Eubacteriales bacterium OttesenSCG-928-K08]|nr:hypothetical protein [Eubacteriales bacterium OttesenSCG-928-K08]
MPTLTGYLKQFDKLAFALSGGPDSAVLLRETVKALGPARVIAITIKGTCTPTSRIMLAQRIAQLAQVEHIVISADTLEERDFCDAPGIRCANCKQNALLFALKEAFLRGYNNCATGLNLSDPVQLHSGFSFDGLVHPFIACKMSSKETMALRGGKISSNYNDCLFERIKDDIKPSFDLLDTIDAIEQALLSAGITAEAHVYKGGVRLVSPSSGNVIVESERHKAAAILAEFGSAPLFE